MKKPTFKPRRLDVEAFAKARERLQGQMTWDALPRLAASVLGPADDNAGTDAGTDAGSDANVGGVHWQAEGLWHQPLGGAAEIRVRLKAEVALRLTCQRCLQPLTQDVGFVTTLRFVEGEEAAQALDEASDEEDVLALTRSLDLEELVEDELIMALPIIPRHGHCALPAAPQPREPSPEASPPGTRRSLAVLGHLLSGSGRPEEPDPGSSG